MKLRNLRFFIESIYEINIAKRSRARNYVYARKVFIRLAKDFGYDWKHMKEHTDCAHDTCIFHYNTFNSVRPSDLKVYNNAIDYFELPMDKIHNVRELSPTRVRDAVNAKINSLNAEDFKYFKANVFDTFMDRLKLEKKFKDQGLELKEGTNAMNGVII